MDSTTLKSLLECPVCLQIPREQVFNCNNGHKICRHCFDTIVLVGGVKKCPQGICAYDQPPHRNRDIEAMIENAQIELPCSNSRSGCPVELMRDELVKHEVKCCYRLVPCPVNSCEKQVMFKDAMLHLAQNYFFQIGRDRKINPNIEYKAIWSFSQAQLNSMDLTGKVVNLWKDVGTGLQFYPQMEKRNGLWYFWIKIHADQEEAANWKFSARVGPGEGTVSIGFSPVHSVDSSEQNIFKSGHYLLLDDPNMEKVKEVTQGVNGETAVMERITIYYKMSKIVQEESEGEQLDLEVQDPPRKKIKQ